MRSWESSQVAVVVAVTVVVVGGNVGSGRVPNGSLAPPLLCKQLSLPRPPTGPDRGTGQDASEAA